MPDAPFAEQQVLVTVPASFDAVARELTHQAAEQAGFRNVTLLEEPQAAFYAWIERHPDWRERVKLGDLILVVDIGGGTTDFTLIAVTEQRRRTGARARRRRRAHPARRRQHGSRAGPHGRAAAGRKRARSIDGLQLQALWHNCRVAKEKLLDPGSKAKEAAGHHSRQRHGPGRRHHQGHAAPRRSRAHPARRLLSRQSPAPTCRSASAASACRKSACPTPPTPPSPGTWRASCASRPQPSSTSASAADPAVSPPHARAVQRRRASTRACCATASSKSSNAWLDGGRHSGPSSR